MKIITHIVLYCSIFIAGGPVLLFTVGPPSQVANSRLLPFAVNLTVLLTAAQPDYAVCRVQYPTLTELTFSISGMLMGQNDLTQAAIAQRAAALPIFEVDELLTLGDRDETMIPVLELFFDDLQLLTREHYEQRVAQ